MAQRILSLAAQDGPERLQEALQSLAEGEVRAARGPGGERGCAAAAAHGIPLSLAAGGHGVQAGPEGEGDGGSAERDFQRWVTSALRSRGCGPSPGGGRWVQLCSTGERHFW